VIVVRMRRGLPKADQDRIWNETVGVLGEDDRLVGSRHWLDTDIIELGEPEDLLPREYYAMMRKLRGVEGVETVYQDNGVRAQPGGDQPQVQARGGFRDFFRNFLGAWRLDDI